MQRIANPVATAHRSADPALQAYQILRLGFVAAPVIAGVDKFTRLLTDWDAYLAPSIASVLPVGVHSFMMVVGVIEIVAGVLVAVRPRLGAYVVAAWLVGIMLDLVLRGHALDIALRDLGLCLGALALARLAIVYDRPHATVGGG